MSPTVFLLDQFFLYGLYGHESDALLAFRRYFDLMKIKKGKIIFNLLPN